MKEKTFIYGVHKSDPHLGLCLAQNATGYYHLPSKENILIATDSLGLRSPIYRVNIKASDSAKKILFLGDSFTFGDAVEFNNTFPGILSNSPNYSVSNAGVGGHGYIHYEIRLPELLEKLTPDIVAIQLSPHSAKRSITGELPAYLHIPIPYYLIIEDSLIIKYPPYQTNYFETSELIATYINKEKNIKNFVSFTTDIAFELYKFQYANDLKSIFKKEQKLKATNSNINKIEHHFVEHAIGLSLINGFKIIFYNIGYPPDQFDMIRSYYSNLSEKVEFINLERSLLENLNQEENFDFAYRHWCCQPPMIIDYHYNDRAHKVMADAFIRLLSRTNYH